jgi:pimeloyl-ACP methyl ester carboxylesterase
MVLIKTPKADSFENKSLQIDTATIYYEVGGAGKPLILIHGLSGSTRWWLQNAAFFARHFQVYMVDLLGFGQGRGQRFALQDSAALLVNWMDKLAIEKASLIGHSMGGYIAIDLATSNPERVDRIVVVDGLVYPLGKAHLQNLWRLLRALRYASSNFLPVLFMDAFRAGLLTMFSAIREVFDADISTSLDRIKTPSLIVWGEYDMVLPVEIGWRLHEQLSGSEFVVIEGAGHNPMWDRPEEFNKIVINFLGQSKGDGFQ